MSTIDLTSWAEDIIWKGANVTPPKGFVPVPNSKKGLWHMRVGNGWRYWKAPTVAAHPSAADIAKKLSSTQAEALLAAYSEGVGGGLSRSSRGVRRGAFHGGIPKHGEEAHPVSVTLASLGKLNELGLTEQSLDKVGSEPTWAYGKHRKGYVSVRESSASITDLGRAVVHHLVNRKDVGELASHALDAEGRVAAQIEVDNSERANIWRQLNGSSNLEAAVAALRNKIIEVAPEPEVLSAINDSPISRSKLRQALAPDPYKSF